MAIRLESQPTLSWMTWSLALGLSLAVHGVLFRLNPDVLSGSGRLQNRSIEERQETRLDDVTLRELQRELPRLVDQVDQQFPDATPIDDPQVEVPEIEVETPNWEPLPEPSLTEQQASLPPPDMPEWEEQEGNWLPRQEVLAVTDQRVTETLDSLPRRFREELPETRNAPDLILPAELPEQPRVAAGVGPQLDLPAGFSSNPTANAVQGLPELGDVPGLGGLPPMLEPDLILPEENFLPEDPIAVEEPVAVESLLRLRTQVYREAREGGAQYVKFQLSRNGIEQLPVLERDLVFLIDHSASMGQLKLNQALIGLRAAIQQLDEEDRFNIISFRDRVSYFQSQPVPATSVNKSRALASTQNLRAYGKTDVFASLEALLTVPSPPERPLLALLVTDGVPTMGVTDSGEILQKFTELNKGEVSMFAVGGGQRANRLLLDFLSYRNRGESRVTERNADIPRALVQVVRELSRPVLTGLELQFSAGQGVAVYPKQLSHLYIDRPLIMVGRFPADTDTVTFQLVGRSGRKEHDMVFTVNLRESEAGSPELRREWAWQALLERLARHLAYPSEGGMRELQRFAESYGLKIPSAYFKE